MTQTGFQTDSTSSVWNFFRWVADIPPRETSPGVRSENKLLFSQAIVVILLPRLLIFCMVVEPQYSGKSAKFTTTCKIPQNSLEILSNICLYNMFGTYLSHWGCLLAVSLQIYHETSSLKQAINVPKLPGTDYGVENWALAMMLKALPLVHFWSVLLLKKQNNDDLC